MPGDAEHETDNKYSRMFNGPPLSIEGKKTLLSPRNYSTVSLGFQYGLSSEGEAPMPVLSTITSRSLVPVWQLVEAQVIPTG